MGYINDPCFRRNRINDAPDFTHIGIREAEICCKGRQIHDSNIASREIENQTLNKKKIIGFTGERLPEYFEGIGKESMSSNRQREKTPIHLYMREGGLQEEHAWRRGELKGEGIDALWIETGERVNRGAGPATPNKGEAGSMHGLPIIHRLLSQSAIERMAELSTSEIAIDPRWADQLIEHGDSGSMKHTPLYLISQPQSAEGLKEELESIALSVEKLRHTGYASLFCCIPIAHSTALYRTYEFLKRDLQVKTIVGLTVNGEESDLLVQGALHIGSLFYEGFADAVLLMPRNHTPFTRHEITNLLAIAKGTLSPLGRYPVGYTIISCPMCGRCEIDIPGMTEEVQQLMHSIETEYREKGMPLEKRGGITVAVMGCNVNGPGEARGADIGIAGGRGGSGTIFLKGRVHVTLPEGELLDRFSQLVRSLIYEKMGTGI